MPSQIDPTKPIDGVVASKADLRANLLAAKNEIEALQNENRVADSIAVMRQNGTAYDHGTLVTVRGYYGAGTEGGGLFVLDGADSETADDDGSVIVDATGQRWKRPAPMAECTPQMFGAIGDGEVDDTKALQAFFDYVTTKAVRQAVIAGTFKVSEGIVANGGATTLYVCNATIIADAPIQDILTVIGFNRVSVTGWLGIIGTTSSGLSSTYSTNGLRIESSDRASFDRLRISGLRGWAVYHGAGSCHFLQIRYLTVNNCGASARDTRAHKVNATAFDRIGSSSSSFQQSVVTVNPAELPADVDLASGGFLIVNRIPHKIISVDHDAGTLNVYPWIKAVYAQPGEFDLVFGGGFMWGSGTAAKAWIGTLEARRCGTVALLGGIGSPMINVFAAQFCAINIALGRSPSSAFGGTTVNAAYFEATVIASILQVCQTTSGSEGSLISGINSLHDYDIVSPRHLSSSSDEEIEQQYTPITILRNNRMLFPWNARDVRISNSSSFTSLELWNTPVPWPYSVRTDGSSFTITLRDDVQHRRIKGNYTAELTLYGRASRQGALGGYNSHLYIVAEAGYTINGTTHQNYYVGPKQMPVTYYATLEDDNAGNKTVWRVTAVEHIAAGEGIGPGIPAAITDLDATTIDHESVSLSYTAADLADSHQYRQSLAGSGSWSAAAALVANTVAGLAAGTAYDFQVRGINTSGVGRWSNIATATTNPAP